MSKENGLHFETLQVHAGQESPDSATGARAVPIYQTTSFVFDDCDHAEARFALRDAGNIYGRLTNPTQAVFEERIAALEGGKAALATSSGAAAITYTLLGLAHAGNHIVAAKTLYGGTYNLLAHTLPDYGIETSFVDAERLDLFESAITEKTRAIYVESLGNPHSNPCDVRALADLAHSHSLPLIVDNTFATPYLLRPFEHGADIVVHSATKFLGGHGTTLGGVIVVGGDFQWQRSAKFPQLNMPHPSYHGLSFADAAKELAFIVYLRAILMRDMGATLSPFHAFLLLQGLETLSLRVERHVENTLEIVRMLSLHPRVERVHHPSLPTSPYHALYTRYFPKGAGSIFTFEVRGGEEAARSVINRLRLFSLLANVADVKSLVIHPASTTHSQLDGEELRASGIYPNTIRLSVGIEHIEDLLCDLKNALEE